MGRWCRCCRSSTRAAAGPRDWQPADACSSPHCDSKPPLGNRARCFPDTTVIGAGSETPASVGSETLITLSRCCHLKSPIGTVLAGGGYWNSVQISAVRARHRCPGSDQERQAHRAAHALTAPRRRGPTDRADRRSTEGRAAYRRRQQIVEPVFAHTKFLRRIEALQRRGWSPAAAPPQAFSAELPQLVARGQEVVGRTRAAASKRDSGSTCVL